MLDGDLAAQIKGRFAEAFVATVLEHAGYQIRRAGVEAIVGDLGIGHWGGVELPRRLQAVPDLLVIDSEEGASQLVEVKFRRSLSEANARGLVTDLRYQREHWPEAWGVIVLAEPPAGRSGRYQDHVRVVDDEGILTLERELPPRERWARLPTLGARFRRVHAVPHFHPQLDRLVPVLEACGSV